MDIPNFYLFIYQPIDIWVVFMSHEYSEYSTLNIHVKVFVQMDFRNCKTLQCWYSILHTHHPSLTQPNITPIFLVRAILVAYTGTYPGLAQTALMTNDAESFHVLTAICVSLLKTCLFTSFPALSLSCKNCFNNLDPLFLAQYFIGVYFLYFKV